MDVQVREIVEITQQRDPHGNVVAAVFIPSENRSDHVHTFKDGDTDSTAMLIWMLRPGDEFTIPSTGRRFRFVSRQITFEGSNGLVGSAEEALSEPKPTLTVFSQAISKIQRAAVAPPASSRA